MAELMRRSEPSLKVSTNPVKALRTREEFNVTRIAANAAKPMLAEPSPQTDWRTRLKLATVSPVRSLAAALYADRLVSAPLKLLHPIVLKSVNVWLGLTV